MNTKTRWIREKISNTLELPKDIVLDVVKVIIIGNQLTIENHKGIIEYNEELIRINTGNGIMCIVGKKLNIKNIIQEEITILGEISGVYF